jgi:hypothetical protein
MLTCKHASYLISQSLDRRLTLSERWSLKLHLLMCRYCKRFANQLLQLKLVVRQQIVAVENDESIKLSQSVRKKIAQAVIEIHK